MRWSPSRFHGRSPPRSDPTRRPASVPGGPPPPRRTKSRDRWASIALAGTTIASRPPCFSSATRSPVAAARSINAGSASPATSRSSRDSVTRSGSVPDTVCLRCHAESNGTRHSRRPASSSAAAMVAKAKVAVTIRAAVPPLAGRGADGDGVYVGEIVTSSGWSALLPCQVGTEVPGAEGGGLGRLASAANHGIARRRPTCRGAGRRRTLRPAR